MLFSVKGGETIDQASERCGVVAMGINPSKRELHQGHYLTMFQALRALHRRRDARGVFFVDNREFHHQLMTERYPELFLLPKAETMSSIATLMRRFVTEVAEYLGDGDQLTERVRIVPMSSYISSPKENASGLKPGERLYSMLHRHRQELSRLFEFDERDGDANFIRPYCADCNFGPRRDEAVTLGGQEIAARCEYHRCATKQYIVDIAGRAHDNWAIHYCVDPLRDVHLSEDHDGERVLHVFGGDYGQQWGRRGDPKAVRLQTFVDEATAGNVDYFIGPLLQRRGAKLSKSSGDASIAPSMETLESIIESRQAVIEV